MKKFRVTEYYKTTMVFEVEAESEDEAYEIVSDDLSESDAKVERHFLDSEVEEI